MKKIFLLITLFCYLSFGQGWNPTVTITSINEPNLEKMDLFTNASGNHILIKRTNGNIVYYNVNSSGTIDANKTATLETSGDFPNIVGSSETVYALYKTGNNIRVKYSTNGGNSWLSSISNRPIGSNLCNGIDAIYEAGSGIHLVWATKDSYPDYETYYYKLTTGHAWAEPKNVTDHASGQIGGSPSVTFSTNRVHVSFNTSGSEDLTLAAGDDAKTRDRVSGTWQTPQPVVTYPERSGAEYLVASGNTLYLFYSRSYPPYNDLRYRTRSITGITWSNYSTRATGINNYKNSLKVTKTSNDYIHLLSDDGYYGSQVSGLIYTFFNGSNWSNPVSVGDDGYKDVSFNSVSNDLFFTQAFYGDNYPDYKQYDANPLTPSNFAGSIHDIGYDAHPKLTWALNNEPDVRGNTSNGYKIERSLNYGAFTTVATLSGSVSTFIDFNVHYAGSGPGTARYKIKSRDINDHESAWSNIVTIQFGNVDKHTANNNIVHVKPENFYLSSNYPNPFNPSTRINYALPEVANVQLKVYDMLGSEVAVLVNETKGAGYHLVDFDASNLSSGIYIYRITAANDEKLLFNETKRMILMK